MNNEKPLNYFRETIEYIKETHYLTDSEIATSLGITIGTISNNRRDRYIPKFKLALTMFTVFNIVLYPYSEVAIRETLNTEKV